MNQENQAYNSQLRNMHSQCNTYMHHHVMVTGADGQSFDGIIVNVDVNNVTVLVGEDVMGREEDEQQDIRYGGYGGYDDDYGRPRRRRYRRYRPRTFPLGSLAALALLPYIARPTPYYPPYPYY